jgi:hypothetical protein
MNFARRVAQLGHVLRCAAFVENAMPFPFRLAGNWDAMTEQTEFAASLSLSIDAAAGDLSIKIPSGTRTRNSSLIAGVLLRLTKNLFSFA